MLATPEQYELEQRRSLNKAQQYRLKARIAQLKIESGEYANDEMRRAIALQIEAWGCVALGYENTARLLEQGKGNLEAITQEYFVS